MISTQKRVKFDCNRVIFRTRVSLNLFRYQIWFFFRNSGFNIKKNCFECFWASALKDIIIYHYMCYYIIIRSSNGARCHMLNSYVENMFSLIVLSSDITKITLSSISTTGSFYFEIRKWIKKWFLRILDYVAFSAET